MDKRPFQSKKFIAFIFAFLGLLGVMIITLFLQTITWPMSSFLSILAVSAGALSIGYVISQTALDKFMNGISNFNVKDKEDD